MDSELQIKELYNLPEKMGLDGSTIKHILGELIEFEDIFKKNI